MTKESAPAADYDGGVVVAGGGCGGESYSAAQTRHLAPCFQPLATCLRRRLAKCDRPPPTRPKTKSNKKHSGATTRSSLVQVQARLAVWFIWCVNDGICDAWYLALFDDIGGIGQSAQFNEPAPLDFTCRPKYNNYSFI